MSKLLVVILCGFMFIAVGCKAEGEVKDNDDKTMSSSSSSTESRTSAGADDCSHCAGKQTAKMAFEATPIFIEDTLYLSTPMNRVIALDAETGEEKWSFDPEVNVRGSYY